jgi:hypothetical protein
MPEPMVGSLIHGDHKIPKKSRPWNERLKLPVAVGLVFIVILSVGYHFYNYQQERAVTQFLDEVFSGRLDQAFSRWDLEGGSYRMEDFLKDWGRDGYYTRGVKSARVVDSDSRGPVVVVYIEIETFQEPLALRVDRQTLKLSYSP